MYKSTVDIQSSLGAKLDDGVKWMFRVSFFLLLFWDNWLLMPGIYNTQRDLYLKVNADLQYQLSTIDVLLIVSLIYSFISEVLRILHTVC